MILQTSSNFIPIWNRNRSQNFLQNGNSSCGLALTLHSTIALSYRSSWDCIVEVLIHQRYWFKPIQALVIIISHNELKMHLLHSLKDLSNVSQAYSLLKLFFFLKKKTTSDPFLNLIHIYKTFTDSLYSFLGSLVYLQFCFHTDLHTYIYTYTYTYTHTYIYIYQLSYSTQTQEIFRSILKL